MAAFLLHVLITFSRPRTRECELGEGRMPGAVGGVLDEPNLPIPYTLSLLTEPEGKTGEGKAVTSIPQKNMGTLNKTRIY